MLSLKQAAAASTSAGSCSVQTRMAAAWEECLLPKLNDHHRLFFVKKRGAAAGCREKLLRLRRYKQKYKDEYGLFLAKRKYFAIFLTSQKSCAIML